MNRSMVVALMLIVSLSLLAQRHITPVKSGSGLQGSTIEQPTDEIDKSRLVETRDESGKIVFVDTVAGTEWVDSTEVKRKAKMIYPTLHSVSVGVNVFDGVMRALGQKYGVGGFWGELSIHNRYFPNFEVGLGLCDDKPKDMNYRFRTPLAPYYKIGFKYNLFYNSNPDYQLFVGARYGFTHFKYSVAATVDDGYWHDPVELEIPDRKCTAGFFELGLGLKVKIVGGLSLGWNVYYHTLLHESKAKDGKPMYLPGFGKRSVAFGADFSIIYTISLNKPAPPVVSEETQIDKE